MNTTPETEWEKQAVDAGDLFGRKVLTVDQVRNLISSRDTYWKERMINWANKNIVLCEHHEQWRQMVPCDELIATLSELDQDKVLDQCPAHYIAGHNNGYNKHSCTAELDQGITRTTKE